MLTPQQYEALCKLMHMVIANVVKDEESASITKLAIDIALLGVYHIVIPDDGGDSSDEDTFTVA